MDVNRLWSQVQAVQNQFTNVELRTRDDRSLFLKFVLQTSVGNMFVGEARLDDYPNSMPSVYITAPSIPANVRHTYRDGRLCYLHPSMWNPGRHDLVFVVGRIAKWLNKYEVWRVKGTWPGAELAH